MKNFSYKLSPSALRDMESLKYYLKEDTAAFLAIKERIKASIKLIQRFPDLGAYNEEMDLLVLQVPKTRYEICFLKTKNLLEIIRIFHTSQHWKDVI
jgi:plasmid stabilization system protein ParE